MMVMNNDTLRVLMAEVQRREAMLECPECEKKTLGEMECGTLYCFSCEYAEKACKGGCSL